MDTEWKSKVLHGLDPVQPAIGSLLARTPVRWAPSAAVMRAQDTVPATSRRVVAEWSSSGADEWSAPESTEAFIALGNNAVPTSTWRTIGTYYANVTPGCELASYAVHCPAGLTQEMIATGSWGDVRVGVTWTFGGSSSGPAYKSAAMAGSTEPEGDASDAPGGNWALTEITQIGRHSPAGFVDDPTIMATYCEWARVEIVIQIRGNPRLLEVVVHEQPLAHTTEHDAASPGSVHAMPQGLAALTPGPMTSAPDGTTYDEQRHGTVWTAGVAERQSERLGPRIMDWVCWDESTTDIWEDAEGTPRTFTSTSLLNLLDSAIASTAYDANTPGWVVGGAHAQLARLCDPTCIARRGFAAVPIRVRVDAGRSAGDGTIRVQCGLYDWVDVAITGARAEYTATGYIEAQAFADDSTCLPLAVWCSVASGTLSVYAVSVDFGTWA